MNAQLAHVPLENWYILYLFIIYQRPLSSHFSKLRVKNNQTLQYIYKKA